MKRSADPKALPSTSAGAVLHDLDDDGRALRVQRNAALFQLLVGSALVVLVAFALLVAAGSRAHRIDARLKQSWWHHHAEYDCCSVTNDKCGPGVEALHELRERLAEREHGPRAVVAGLVAAGLGLGDIDVTDAPADAADVDAWFAKCPALPR